MGLQLLMPQCEVQTMYVHEVLAEGGAERLETALGSVDRWVYLKCTALADFAARFEGVPYPEIAFNAFHPDEVKSKTYLIAATQDCHSAIGIWGYNKGLSAGETASLFTVSNFEQLGYMDCWNSSVEALRKSFEGTSLDFKEIFVRVKRQLPFMLTTYHPKMHFVAELSRHVALQLGYAGDPHRDPIEHCMYEMLSGLPWPCYPGVADRFGFPGSLRWRSGTEVYPSPASYLSACFALYPARGTIECERLDDGLYDAVLGRRL